jgi:hypothetical protein
MAPIYRAPMRSRDLDVSPWAGAAFGVGSGVVGIGEALDPAPASLEEAIEVMHATRGEKPGRMLERFARLPEGTYVWTRTGEDAYRLGRIAGPWRYEDSDAARRVGIHHLRPARWAARAFDGRTVPAAVRATFERGGRNLQRTHDHEAEQLTAELWEAG